MLAFEGNGFNNVWFSKECDLLGCAICRAFSGSGITSKKGQPSSLPTLLTVAPSFPARGVEGVDLSKALLPPVDDNEGEQSGWK